MPLAYAYVATAGMRQGLFKLYSGDKPVGEDTHFQVQLDRFVAAHRARANVGKELGVKAFIEDKDGKRHNLAELTDKEIAKILKETTKFKKYCKDSYAGYKSNFAANKKLLTDRKLLKEGF
jgi:hypothetical protein